jgi:predicted Zn finger-like uncharacterized protein
MKIVCGSCQAKYSIADEKVAGKVFKIRCKRCGEVIVVHGDQDAGAAAPAAAAAYDTGADAIWHVVINGEQAGPYSPAQLGEMLTNAQVDWEAYVWCEGFDNWAAMRDVPDLVAAITGQGQAAQQAQPAAFATQPSMGADPFADDGGGGGGGLFAEPAPAAAPARSNLFGGGHDSPFDGGGGGGGVVASAPSPRVSAEQAMTGARNENSVLFSLKNLQALATGGSAPAAGGGAPMMSAGNRPGFAGGDGSGLIDIRALASATGVSDSRREEAEKDALLSLGSNQTGAFGALGSPMLAPVASDDGGSKKGLILAIVGGFAMLAAAGVVAAVLLRPQAPQQAGVAAPPALPPAAAMAAAANPQAAPAAPAEAPSEGELAAKKAAEAEGQSGEKRASSGGGGTARRKESGGGDSKPASADSDLLAAKPAAAAEDKPKAKGGSSSIDDLLDGAIGSGGSAKAAPKKEAAPAADSNLPEKPSRDDVINAMNSVKDAVSACGNGAGGVAFANVSVSGKTGRVTSAEITGITGEVGSCIARAVRKANFGKFQSDSFQVKYPFRL